MQNKFKCNILNLCLHKKAVFGKAIPADRISHEKCRLCEESLTIPKDDLLESGLPAGISIS